MKSLESRSGPFEPSWLEWRAPVESSPAMLPYEVDFGLARPSGAVEV